MKKYYVLHGETFQGELICVKYFDDFTSDASHQCLLVKNKTDCYFYQKELKPAPEYVIVAYRLQGLI